MAAPQACRGPSLAARMAEAPGVAGLVPTGKRHCGGPGRLAPANPRQGASLADLASTPLNDATGTTAGLAAHWRLDVTEPASVSGSLGCVLLKFRIGGTEELRPSIPPRLAGTAGMALASASQQRAMGERSVNTVLLLAGLACKDSTE